MTRRTYLRWCLLLPLLVPLLTLPLWASGRPWGMVGAMLGGSLLIAGPPYVIVAAALAILLRRADLRTTELAAAWAPVAFAVAFAAYIMFLGTGAQSAAEYVGGFLYVALISMFVGYIYVLLAFAGAHVLTRLGMVDPEPTESEGIRRAPGSSRDGLGTRPPA